MALPPSFQNSFWTPDFKLDALWPKIRAGVVENQEILRLVSVSYLMFTVLLLRLLVCRSPIQPHPMPVQSFHSVVMLGVPI